jgi:hypothetical protein
MLFGSDIMLWLGTVYLLIALYGFRLLLTDYRDSDEAYRDSQARIDALLAKLDAINTRDALRRHHDAAGRETE